MGETQVLKKLQSVAIAGVLAMTLGLGFTAGSKAFADDSLQAGGVELATQIDGPELGKHKVLYPGKVAKLWVKDTVADQTGTWTVTSDNPAVATAEIIEANGPEAKVKITALKAGGPVNITATFTTDKYGKTGDHVFTISVTGAKDNSTFTKTSLKYKVTHNALNIPPTGNVQVIAPKSIKYKSISVPTVRSYKGRDYNVTTIKSKALANMKNLKSLKIGKNVKKIGSSFLYKSSKLKTLIINSKKLTKTGVKNCLKGSSVKTVKVPEDMVSTYKTYFTKANCGKDVKVEAA